MEVESMRSIIKFDGYTNLVKRKSRSEIKLRGTEEKPILSICGSMRGCSGQCLDTIAKYNSDPLFRTLYRLWKRYHLNDMHVGTETQEKAIERWQKEGHRYDYGEVCEYLKSIGLYEDNGYRYGSGWLYRPIPEEDLEIIKSIIKTYE